MSTAQFSHQLKQAFSSKGVRRSTLSISGNVFAAGFSAVAIILVTRLLGPEKFGEFSVAWAILILLARVSDLGFTYALQKYVGNSTKKSYINTIFSISTRIKIIFSGLLALIGLFITPYLTEIFHLEHPALLYAAFISLPVTVMYDQVHAMLQSLHRIEQSVMFAINQAVIKMVICLVMYYLVAIDIVAIFLLFAGAPLVPLIGYKLFFPSWTKINIFEPFKSSYRLLKTTATHAAVGYMCLGIIENSDILFVKHHLTSFETGLLGGVSKISLMIILFSYSLGAVLYPRVARYKKLTDLTRFMKKAFLFIGVSVVAYLVALPLTPYLIKFTIGEQYLAGVWILNIAMGAAFLTFASIPFIATFFSHNVPWFFSLVGILQLLIVVIGNLLFVPVFGLDAAVWTRVVSQAVLFIVSLSLSLYFFRQKQLAAQT